MRALVAGEIVHDHDIVGLQFGRQELLDLDLQGLTVDGAVVHDGRDRPVGAQAGDEGGGFPVMGWRSPAGPG